MALGQVARELWLLSGNECTFTGCGERLIREDGFFIGEVAHIHGAEPTSARHDPVLALDKDALRAASNLMLLCPNHHTVIDHPQGRNEHPASKLQRMKKKHEDRFRRAAEHIEALFTDHTRAATVHYAATMCGFDAKLGYVYTAGERAQNVAHVKVIADSLAGVTPSARSLLAFLVAADDLLGTAEVSRRSKRSSTDIRRVMEELDRLGYAYQETEPEEGEPRAALKLRPHDSFDGWDFWGDLKNFCDGDATGIEQVIVDLDFTLLD
ncbi:HNH endonuclease [Streptomyces sp. NPDC051183]|uniref:HNH endonuclease n=1 Tax=Streptomyces sp. NPDC051183 TaxID=3155165 RepID=UPI00342EBCCF